MAEISQASIAPQVVPQVCVSATDLFARHSAVALSLPKGTAVDQRQEREAVIERWVAEYLLRFRQEPAGTPLATQLADHLVNAAQLWFRGPDVREPEFMPTCLEVLTSAGKQGHATALILAQLFSRSVAQKDNNVTKSVDQLDLKAAYDCSVTTGLFCLKLVNDLYENVGRRLIEEGRLDEGQGALRKSIEVVHDQKGLLVASRDLPTIGSIVARVNTTYFYLLEACQDKSAETELVKGLYEFQSIPYRFLSAAAERRNKKSLIELKEILTDLENGKEPDFPEQWEKLGAPQATSSRDPQVLPEREKQQDPEYVRDFLKDLVTSSHSSLTAKKFRSVLRSFKDLNLTLIDSADVTDLVSITIERSNACQASTNKVNFIATLLESGLPFQADDISRSVGHIATLARTLDAENPRSDHSSALSLLKGFSTRVRSQLDTEPVRGALMRADAGIWLPGLHNDNSERVQPLFRRGLRGIQGVLARYMGDEGVVESKPISPELGRAGLWMFNDLLESVAPRMYPKILESYLPYLRASAAAVLATNPNPIQMRDITTDVFAAHTAVAGEYLKKGRDGMASRIWDSADRFAESHQLSRAQLYEQKGQCLLNAGDRVGAVKAFNDSILESFRDLKKQVDQGGGLEVAEHLTGTMTQLLNTCGDRHIGSTKVAYLVGRYMAGVGERLEDQQRGNEFFELASEVLTAGLSKIGEVQRSRGETRSGADPELRIVRGQITQILDLLPKH